MNQIYKGVGRAVTTAASAVRKTVERGVKMGRQLAEQGARAGRLGASRALRLARTAADMIPSPRRVAATCFVAGTLVLSAEGLVPIETIAVGDEVWSRDEASGAEAWQTVEDTFITHPKELIYLEYEIANAEGGGSDYGELIGTAEHPFWVTNREAWVPMGELEIGDQLQLAHDGGEAIVTKLTVEIAPQGETFTTYNFAVSNWATYFVAPKNSPPNTAGIWVHNLGEKTCEQILQTLNTAIDSGKSQKVHQINKILSNAHAQGKLDPKVLAQAQEKIDAATKAGKISPATKTPGIGKYKDVGGHHIHAKAAFKDNSSYSLREGWSISQKYMKDRGWNHQAMTNYQRQAYKEMREGVRPDTIQEHNKIAIEALEAGGATRADVDPIDWTGREPD